MRGAWLPLLLLMVLIGATIGMVTKTLPVGPTGFILGVLGIVGGISLRRGGHDR